MRIKLHINLGEGLKRARKDKSQRDGELYSQRDFAEDMNVTIDTIRDWEQDYHLPKTADLLYMCDDIFQCDLDYLFMRSDVRKHDVEFIMKYTGLSEKAVEKLVKLKNDSPSYLEPLNFLLEHDRFDKVLQWLAFYSNSYMRSAYITYRIHEKEKTDEAYVPTDEEFDMMLAKDSSEYEISKSFDQASEEYLEKIRGEVMDVINKDIQSSKKAKK